MLALLTRIPLLLYDGVMLLFTLVYFYFSFLWSIFRFFFDCILEHNIEKKQRSELKSNLDNVTSYEQYVQVAEQLDQLNGYDLWKRENESTDFDYQQIEDKLFYLKEQLNGCKALKAKNIKPSAAAICLTLRSLANRNLAGINNPNLHKCAVGTKNLIEEYTDQVCNMLHFIRDTEFEDMSLLDKFMFFKDTSQAFGRSALLLSGGAILGMYHIGVIKALYDQSLLPRIISGTSAGSIVASVLCIRTPEEIPQCFEKGYFKLDAFKGLDNSRSPIRKLMRFFKSGVLMDVQKLADCLRNNIGDVTFLEAYHRSGGRILNITVSSKGFAMPSLLNFLTAPNVLIWSAAVASCSIPGVYKPVALMAKDSYGNIIPYHGSSIKFSDGSLYADLPQARLSELFNVNFSIVSQTNPHVLPFLNDAYEIWYLQGSCLFSDESSGKTFWTKCKHFIFSEFKHRILQLYQYGLVPQQLSLLENVISQQYTGDITILPAEYSFSTLSRLLKNPTDEYIESAIINGARKTFPKISSIEVKCRIEGVLDECCTQVRENLLGNIANGKTNVELPDELLIPLAAATTTTTNVNLSKSIVKI